MAYFTSGAGAVAAGRTTVEQVVLGRPSSTGPSTMLRAGCFKPVRPTQTRPQTEAHHGSVIAPGIAPPGEPAATHLPSGTYGWFRITIGR